MSTYEYTDSIGDKLRISSNGYGGATLVAEGKSSLRRKTILIKHEDAPTVAAELLKAAGQESVIVAKSAYEVQESEHWLRCGTDGDRIVLQPGSTPEQLRNIAANYVAVAEYIEGNASREAEAEKKLQERRDVLVSELGGYEDAYDAYPTGGPMQKAIDRIIELQDAAK